MTEVAEPPGLLDATGEIAVGLLPNHECLIESHPPDIPLRRFTEQAGIGYLTGKVTFARGSTRTRIFGPGSTASLLTI